MLGFVLEEVADDWGVLLVLLEAPMAGVAGVAVEALMGQTLQEEVEEVRTAHGYCARERSWQLAPR